MRRGDNAGRAEPSVDTAGADRRKGEDAGNGCGEFLGCCGMVDDRCICCGVFDGAGPFLREGGGGGGACCATGRDCAATGDDCGSGVRVLVGDGEVISISWKNLNSSSSCMRFEILSSACFNLLSLATCCGEGGVTSCVPDDDLECVCCCLKLSLCRCACSLFSRRSRMALVTDAGS